MIRAYRRWMAAGLGLAALSAGPCAAAWLEINGAPLTIRGDEYGTLGVLRRENNVLVPQYYATCAKGSALFLNGSDPASRWGNGTATFALWDDAVTGRFTTVSHSQPMPWTIQTVLRAGTSGVQVTQTAAYTNGESTYTLTWQIANQSQGTYSNLHFIHGGDVALSGEDFAIGAWDAITDTVSVRATNTAGNTMGLWGDSGSRSSGHYENHFQLVRDAAKAGGLPGTVESNSLDAAYALQWDRAVLAAGQTWTIVAHETWSGSVTQTPMDVTGALLHPLFTGWRLNRQTGTLLGSLRLQNGGQTPLRTPVWIAIQVSPDMRFMHPTDTLKDGRGYLDLTAAFNAALSDGRLDPGESVTIPDIEVYTKNRAAPPDTAFSVWAASGQQTGPF